jgi:hypothetical protein
MFLEVTATELQFYDGKTQDGTRYPAGLKILVNKSYIVSVMQWSGGAKVIYLAGGASVGALVTNEYETLKGALNG